MILNSFLINFKNAKKKVEYLMKIATNMKVNNKNKLTIM